MPTALTPKMRYQVTGLDVWESGVVWGEISQCQSGAMRGKPGAPAGIDWGRAHLVIARRTDSMRVSAYGQKDKNTSWEESEEVRGINVEDDVMKEPEIWNSVTS